MNELMTPNDRASQLCLDFWVDNSSTTLEAINNAIKAVNLILNETGCGNCKEIDSHYWNKVLHELELMKETN